VAISDIINRADAAHLLRRAGFGGSDAEISALVGRTRRDSVDSVMGFRSTDPTPTGPDVGVPSFIGKAHQWDAHSEVINWWVLRMSILPNLTALPASIPAVAAPTPLQEKMTLFWHDHFACGQDKVHDIPAMWDQISMFRRLGLGDFGTLLRSVAVHPAMLVYLDNQSNVVGSEQENYARELMELHTIGVGEFTEDDVIAMARAWTGHNIVGWNGSEVDSTYVYRPEDHDHGQKTLFGITANWNGLVRAAGEREVIAEFVTGARQAATARFLARKLFRWFAHLEPSSAVVQSLADAFVSSGMNISALVRAVLEHDEFWGTLEPLGADQEPHRIDGERRPSVRTARGRHGAPLEHGEHGAGVAVSPECCGVGDRNGLVVDGLGVGSWPNDEEDSGGGHPTRGSCRARTRCRLPMPCRQYSTCSASRRYRTLPEPSWNVGMTRLMRPRDGRFRHKASCSEP